MIIIIIFIGYKNDFDFLYFNQYLNNKSVGNCLYNLALTIIILYNFLILFFILIGYFSYYLCLLLFYFLIKIKKRSTFLF